MQTLNQQGVYLALRAAVLTGRLAPGERVIETEVAARAGVSRTPVREAIHRLLSEGLLAKGRGRGVVVAGLEPDELRQTIPVRAALEGLVVRLAAPNLDAAGLERLLACVDRAEAALAVGDALALNEAGEAFHRELSAAAANRVLAQTLDAFRARVSLSRAQSLQIPWRPQDSVAEHRAVYAALATGDAEAAERMMVQHVTRAGELALEGAV